MRRHVKGKDPTLSSENVNSLVVKNLKAPIVRKGKLVVVDLAGSERIDKSGVCLQLIPLLTCLFFTRHEQIT